MTVGPVPNTARGAGQRPAAAAAPMNLAAERPPRHRPVAAPILAWHGRGGGVSSRPRSLYGPPAMTDDAPIALPDRLSVDPRSPHHDAELLNRGVGIRFNGAEKTNVEEYCISEGWVRVAVGKTLDRKGNPLTIKLQGKVEPYVKDEPAEG